MTVTHRRPLHFAVSCIRRRRAMAISAATLAAATMLTAAAPAQAHANPTVRVMTRNLYLGASLTPALTATDTPSFLGAVAKIYGTAQFTDFPTRAEALADEIKATRPQLIGLQEVSVWETSGPGVPATLDFLTTLQSALVARGLNYRVAATSANANIGPVPLVSPCGSTVVGACLVTLKDRDVILADAGDRRLRWWGAKSGNYTAQQTFTPPVPGSSPVSFDRGWASIEGSYAGERFRMVNTHLETEDFAAVQEAQAAEFLAGPARSRGAVIATGDFNSAADGSTTRSYALLTASFRDAWNPATLGTGLSCCQNETLTNGTSQAATRIDLVLGRHGVRPVTSRLVGGVPFRTTAAPLWASDHAGVVATLRLDG